MTFCMLSLYRGGNMSSGLSKPMAYLALSYSVWLNDNIKYFYIYNILKLISTNIDAFSFN